MAKTKFSGTTYNNIQYIQSLFFTFLIKKNVNIFFRQWQTMLLYIEDPLSFRTCVQMNPFDLFKKIASMQLRTNL